MKAIPREIGAKIPTKLDNAPNRHPKFQGRFKPKASDTYTDLPPGDGG